MRFLSVLVLFLLFSGCYNQERNCADYKTGKFEFEAISGTEVFKTTIVRNDTLEIDFFQGKSDTSSIRWINDCEYVIKKLNPKNQAEKKAILIKILTTSENEYTFEFSEVGKTKSSKGLARRVREN
ncbi:DNA topoisomerase IV [Aequorivita sp. H23M31]|uniref:DNA topoisomerase IV n=1 Tax=Aequorivita ciconiae TaxID=2494375 RepID=A0A410FZY0_9FLAO|nr:DNA topoisomerase IV [Aequorivita sp. H23M31]QAA80578.1 DNA topoisomerase IV [Aequorivita sp. H23M31]